ncbi:MAG: NTP transferase domain-containing protein [Actinomycetota bacterium]|nr:NTP transferase domain-containing protein [Actinomycetota bacterium]
MKCVILAAGRGDRLVGNDGVKPLFPLLGLPLLERVILTAAEAGLTEFVVVTGHQAARVEAFLAELRLRTSLSITAVRSEAWEAGNGISLLAAQAVLDDESFVLLMADHVFRPTMLERLVTGPLEDGEVVLAVDSRLGRNRVIDPAEATKVVVRHSRIVAIGKDLEGATGYDTGIFACSRGIFAAVERSTREGDATLTGGVRRLAERGRVRALDVGDDAWVDVDTPTDLRRARALLRSTLGKPHDGFVSRALNRKVSARLLTPFLLRLWPGITANHVSALGFAVAVAAAAAFFFGAPLAGGLAVQLASILDGSDGEVARLKMASSPFGSFFDAVLDRYADALVLFGAGSYAWVAGEGSALFGPAWSWLTAAGLVLAVTGNLMVSYSSARSVVDLGYRYEGRWTAAGRGRDWRLFVLFLGGLLAWIDPVAVVGALLLIGLATNGLVAARLWTSWRLARPCPPGLGASAVVFDLDGTVADTMPLLTSVAIDVLGRYYGLDRDEARRRYLETVGLDFASQLEELFPGRPENARAATEFEACKRGGVLACPLLPDVAPTLEFLERRSVKRFLCSSTTPELVAAYLEHHGLRARFDDCLGYRPGFGKDRQVAVLLDRHRLDPAQALFVGDAPRDHEVVEGTGVRFVGIRRLFGKAEFRRRGLASVPDLAALTRSWEQAERLERGVSAAAVPLHRVSG